MYAKYESLLRLPKPILAAIGAALIAFAWWLGEVPPFVVVVLVAFLGLALAAGPLCRRADRLGLTPNHLTFAGLAVSLISIWPLAAGRLRLGLLLILASAMLDVADGYLARTTGRTTERGGFLDSVLDRVADAALFIGLALYFAGLDRLEWAGVCLAALVGAFMVSYTRAKAERYLEKCDIGLGGERPDRMIALLSTGLIGYPEIGLGYVIVFAWLTAIRRVVFTWKRLAD